ncbi:hypothetical protein [Algoriphagus machipongonensis]|uniref:Uncharacterized protein n=1 Tax=Algoriphagus machipongonensis TaxID=388413 RepID=A3I1N9_9BACT|nr:hypothetical protein [Algoriphagus machipongonensis]EAZ79705.1 hypothetical protein ALPR1_08773 [Algoriphagus machipongonensis]
MIKFDPSFPILWLIVFVIFLTAILGAQMVFTFKSKITKQQKIIRGAIYGFIYLSLLGFIFQPTWQTELTSEPVLVYSDDVTSEELKYLRDSLDLRKSLSIEKYSGEGNPVYLVGSRFSDVELNLLSGKEIQLLSNRSSVGLEFIIWKGFVRQGELQKIIGKTGSDSAASVILKAGELIIAEDSIHAGQRNFELQFTSEIIGRNEFELVLNNESLGQVRFFSSPSSPKSYDLRFSYPGPESRFLGQFLAGKSEYVKENIQISRSSEIRSVSKDLDSVRIIIADVDQLKSKKTLNDFENTAMAAFLIDSYEPKKEAADLNKLYQTDFEVQKISEEESRVLESGLEALPFQFVPKAGQKLLMENAVAIQNVGGKKIGMSLINQSFPMYLSGDTLTYQLIWSEILGELYPDEDENWKMDAPVFEGLSSILTFNSRNNTDEFTLIGGDTLFFHQDIINPFSQFTQVTLSDSGWINLSDTLEIPVYGEKEFGDVSARMRLANFLKNQSMKAETVLPNAVEVRVSDWVWLVLFLIGFGVLWFEPRIR